MDRRRFFRTALHFTVGTSFTSQLAHGGVFEDLLAGTNQNHGSLLARIDTVLVTAEKAFSGFIHGYGLGLHQVLGEVTGPLPTTPKRSHAGWPHVHCVCHCNTVANLGDEAGVMASRIGGMSDEVNQAFLAQLFYDTIYPMTWRDLVARHDGESDPISKARLEMRHLMDYTFGDAKLRRRAFRLASLKDRSNRQKLKDYRNLILGIVDALESAWQRSDFYDNELGRQGGLKCPKSLTPSKKREWCSSWCTGHGIPTDVAEGPGTKRPWGPMHPLFPGPVPTIHDVMHGDLRKPFDRKLSGPPTRYVPASKPALTGLSPEKDNIFPLIATRRQQTA